MFRSGIQVFFCVCGYQFKFFECSAFLAASENFLFDVAHAPGHIRVELWYIKFLYITFVSVYTRY